MAAGPRIPVRCNDGGGVMWKVIGGVVVVAAVIFGTIWKMSSGAKRVRAINDANVVLAQAEIAKVTYATRRPAVETLDSYMQDIRGHLKEVEAENEDPEVLINRTAALNQLLKSLSEQRSAAPAPTPASPPLGPGLRPIPPPPVLGGGDPVRPPVAAAPPPSASGGGDSGRPPVAAAPPAPAPAASSESRCSMDAYARNSLSHWCRGFAEPKPEQCRCL